MMNKKWMAILCVMGLTAAAFTGCGAKETAAEAETAAATTADATTDATADATAAEAKDTADTKTEAAAERSKFTIGFDAEFAPYGFMNEAGDYVGFDLDLAKEVCDRNGWEFVAQPIDWDAKDMELNAGSIDCIWNGFTMQGREEDYTWTVPYVDNSQVFVVAADSGIASQADLAGKNVGVQKDSSALAALEGDAANLAGTFADLQQYADYNIGFMDLEQGAIDALAIDIGVANYQILSRGEGFTILEEHLASEQYGIGFKLGNEELKNQVEKTLLEMVDDGTFLKIAETYDKFGLTESICLGK